MRKAKACIMALVLFPFSNLILRIAICCLAPDRVMWPLPHKYNKKCCDSLLFRFQGRDVLPSLLRGVAVQVVLCSPDGLVSQGVGNEFDGDSVLNERRCEGVPAGGRDDVVRDAERLADFPEVGVDVVCCLVDDFEFFLRILFHPVKDGDDVLLPSGYLLECCHEFRDDDHMDFPVGCFEGLPSPEDDFPGFYVDVPVGEPKKVLDVHPVSEVDASPETEPVEAAFPDFLLRDGKEPLEGFRGHGEVPAFPAVLADVGEGVPAYHLRLDGLFQDGVQAPELHADGRGVVPEFLLEVRNESLAVIRCEPPYRRVFRFEESVHARKGGVVKARRAVFFRFLEPVYLILEQFLDRVLTAPFGHLGQVGEVECVIRYEFCHRVLEGPEAFRDRMGRFGMLFVAVPFLAGHFMA